MQVETRLVYNVVSTVLLVAFIFLMQRFAGSRLRELKGYSRFVYFVTFIMTLLTVAALGYFWDIFNLLIGSLTAAGVLGLITALAVLPLLTDMVNGILLHLDRDIDVGVDIEIDGRRGVIREISLTRTRVMNGEYLMIVPNRKFRESVVLVRKKKVGPKIL